ncbi:MAG: hypothetical protein ABI172_00735 [Ginsengibacter sp.]|jgi:hypothetical protein
MKYYKPIGLLACALLIISCFLPWAYYSDLNESFSGFFSEQNIYGKPGIVFIFVAVVSVYLIYTNKVWAKRLHIIIAAINVAYLIKTYILFTSCYATLCPKKEYGLYLLIASTLILMIISFLPDMKMPEIKEGEV